MLILAVDPSVNNVGLALYDTKTEKLKTRTFHPPKVKRQYIVNSIIRTILIEFLPIGEKIGVLIVEYPNFQNSVKGQIAAQKGYTLDLAYIAGALTTALTISPDNVHLPTPMEWKGTAPKAAIGRRFERRWKIPADSVTDHQFEAAMMIDWYLNL